MALADFKGLHDRIVGIAHADNFLLIAPPNKNIAPGHRVTAVRRRDGALLGDYRVERDDLIVNDPAKKRTLFRKIIKEAIANQESKTTPLHDRLVKYKEDSALRRQIEDDPELTVKDNHLIITLPGFVFMDMFYVNLPMQWKLSLTPDERRERCYYRAKPGQTVLLKPELAWFDARHHRAHPHECNQGKDWCLGQHQGHLETALRNKQLHRAKALILSALNRCDYDYNLPHVNWQEVHRIKKDGDLYKKPTDMQDVIKSFTAYRNKRGT